MRKISASRCTYIPRSCSNSKINPSSDVRHACSHLREWRPSMAARERDHSGPFWPCNAAHAATPAYSVMAHSLTRKKQQDRCTLSPPLSQRLHMHARHRQRTRQSTCARNGCGHCPRHAQRSKCIAPDRSDHPGRPVHRSSTRSPPGSPRPLERLPTAPGGSRTHVERSKSIFSTVHRAYRPARRL